jgi:hypothetical protein
MSRDAPVALAPYRPCNDRISPPNQEVVTREADPTRAWRVNAAVPHVTVGPQVRKWPAVADRPIRARSLSEISDNGRRAFRAMADWITIYLFALVEGGRLPQDGAIEYVLSESREFTCHRVILYIGDSPCGGQCLPSSPRGNSSTVS